VACTGFHRRRYYASTIPLWELEASAAADRFIVELEHGLLETVERRVPVRAGFVKAACEATLASTPRTCWRELPGPPGRPARRSPFTRSRAGGRGNRRIPGGRGGASPTGDPLPHRQAARYRAARELAQAGVLLEYDTFHRPKYDPEANLWPLIEQMAAAGSTVRSLWPPIWRPCAVGIRGGPGPASLPGSIRARLRVLDLPAGSVERMLGSNIATRLAETLHLTCNRRQNDD